MMSVLIFLIYNGRTSFPPTPGQQKTLPIFHHRLKTTAFIVSKCCTDSAAYLMKLMYLHDFG